MKELAQWFKENKGYTPDFAWWTASGYEAADKSLKEYAAFLDKEIVKPSQKEEAELVGHPIGPKALVEDLAHDLVAYSLDDLLAIAESERTWCLARLKEASRELGFGDDWKKALEETKKRHVPPGRIRELINEFANEALAFVKSKDLMTVPPLCKEIWRIEMIGTEIQKIIPFACYSDNAIGVAYPAEEMEHDRKLMALRANNIHFSRAIVHHELIPGHRLQDFMAQRIRSHRRLFDTPFFAEGWGLYCETLFWDKGWARDAYDRIGILIWRMHRSAHITLTIKFHRGEMLLSEMVDFLVDTIGLERPHAKGEVRRSIGKCGSPLYKASYLTGALRIRALHKECVESKKMTDREFHDRLLTYGMIPIELIRADLLGLELTQEFSPRWKFYEAKLKKD